MTDTGGNRSAEPSLFDVDEYRADDIGYRHQIPSDAQADLSPVERLLQGALPVPTDRRWKPLRCGLVNLYLFDNAVFPFADGRLLLRGDNGAGKSRVLALTLPLLLDGRLHPSRVEPDRDSNRQIAWNLLMDEHQDRTGYTWIEFGRRDSSGQAVFTTLGIGLRAVRNRGITDHWMFVTEQRVGRSLSLITPERRVASKRVLTDTLAGRGQLYESSTDYRRAVDEALFRLGDRYEALLDLLLQLRQPQLAKKLDLAGLEAALIQAMPPVSSTLLSDAADAFRSLDQERETLAALQQARLTVQDFMRPYRRHLRLGIRRAAARVRTGHAGFEQAGRDLREVEGRQQEAQQTTETLMARREETRRQHKAAQTALQTLQSDPAMKQADRLNSARQLHEVAQAAYTAAESVHERLQTEVQAATDEVASAEHETELRRQRAWQLRDQLLPMPVPEPLQSQTVTGFRELLATGKVAADDTTGAVTTSGVTEPIQALHQQLLARRQHWQQTGQHLQQLDVRVQEASEALRGCVRRLNDGHDQQQTFTDELQETGDQQQTLAEQFRQQVELWWKKAGGLAIGSPDNTGFPPEWLAWSEQPTGRSPLQLAADRALQQFTSGIATERSALLLQQDRLREQQLAHEEERQRLQNNAEANTERLTSAQDGVSFQDLVEFVPAVSHADRGGWEAALRASGLLYARLSDGPGLQQHSGVVLLSVQGEVVEQPADRLSRVLTPAASCREVGVDPAVVGQLLDRIGAKPNSHSLWLAPDGRWQNGLLLGREEPGIPRDIGDEARAIWRDRCLESLRDQQAQLQQAMAENENQRQALSQREADAEQIRSEFPDDGALRTVAARRDEIRRQMHLVRQRVEEATRDEQAQRTLRDQLRQERNTVALDTGLLNWAERPAELLQSLTAWQNQLDQTVDAWKLLATTEDRLRRCQRQADGKREETARHAQQLTAAAEQAQHRQVALQELRNSVGTDAQEITRRIADKERELEELAAQADEIDAQLRQAESACVRLEAQRDTLAGILQRTIAQRQQAVDGLAELADLQLLPTADSQLADVPQAPGSLTTTIELARQISRLNWRGPETDDEDAWKRSQRQIYDALEPLKGRLTAFSMNAEPEFVGEHLCRVQIRHQAELVTPDQLVRRLGDEVDEHERVLSESERTILEKHLLGEVAGELHERMQQAQELVDSMNREVTSRPMKTGMQMRFRWEPDNDAMSGLTAACRTLSRPAAEWPDQERRDLGEFLHEQITLSREQEDAGSRLEQLTTALDYRRWHRLKIDRRASQDQDWKLLTRRTYGSGSGGEKAIALTLPQVAAAAAYYRTGHPHAPRLILMDEVFAGISANNRAACMELLAAFELDVVMTSESEWGCYATVPQLAICQLTRVPDLSAIDNTVYVWNGSARLAPEDAGS